MKPRLVSHLAVLPLLLAAVLPGCALAPGAEKIVVLGPWIDDPGQDRDERDIFNQVLQDYARDNGLTIEYRGTRAIGPALRAKVKSDTLPDIAIMPNVGELAAYTSENVARPLEDVGQAQPPAGTGIQVDHRALRRDGKPYALAVKTDLKSMVLARRATVPAGTDAGRITWPELLGARPARTWCLGLSASSAPGWPGTDWIEDTLLGQAGPETYQRWASGTLSWKAIAAQWSQFLSVIDQHTEHGARGALLTTPQQAAAALLNRPEACTVLHQSSVFAGTTDTGDIDVIATPAWQADPGIEVSGDFAALFSDNPEARKLLTYLVRAGGDGGGRAWVKASDGAVYPVDVDPADRSYSPLHRRVAQHLADAKRRCIDASDAMPATMASAFHAAILESIAYPDRLPDILTRLDQVREGTRTEWLRVTCTP